MSTASLLSSKFLILLQMASFPAICFLPFVKRNMFLMPTILILQSLACLILLFGNFTAGELFAILAPSVALFIHGYILNQLIIRNETGSVDIDTDFIIPSFLIISLPSTVFVEIIAVYKIFN